MLFNQCFLSCRAPAKARASFYLYRGMRLLLPAICFFSYISLSEAGLKIYYIRHAEAGHNVVKEWANVPKAQRPVYVGNPNMFTPKGKTQVVAATRKLQRYHFDFIAVSPMWRTRHTILPYLKATGAKAEIWPELHEIGGGSKILSTNLPSPSVQILNAGPPIKLPTDEVPYFSLRKGASNDFKLPSGKAPEREAGIRLVLQHVIDMVLKRFGGTDDVILLVGHGNSGKALLKALTRSKLADTPPMANAEMWMVEEQPDGYFKLEMYNDTPYETSATPISGPMRAWKEQRREQGTGALAH